MGNEHQPLFPTNQNGNPRLEARGLLVWADDVTPETVGMWLKAGVNGFKVEIEELVKNPFFIEQLRNSKKPIVVERIETEEQHQWIRKLGVTLGQGFYYGMPCKEEKTIPLHAAYIQA